MSATPVPVEAFLDELAATHRCSGAAHATAVDTAPAGPWAALAPAARAHVLLRLARHTHALPVPAPYAEPYDDPTNYASALTTVACPATGDGHTVRRRRRHGHGHRKGRGGQGLALTVAAMLHRRLPDLPRPQRPAPPRPARPVRSATRPRWLHAA
ncbi:hypothetical protein [Streptomyces litchfieldiae]|uniref:Uncharacterized protein n=1 Tax=Streptomyces litchfieldiae TaxID=3075543 RepID=A0ABU2N1F2_9ACTN|nr:hypothetical protein [Streptomyces sp. DSM 44938]MDT0347735.1 hypothetical protein [Streptomyces sp. DSM 44938]